MWALCVSCLLLRLDLALVSVTRLLAPTGKASRLPFLGLLQIEVSQIGW